MNFARATQTFRTKSEMPLATTIVRDKTHTIPALIRVELPEFNGTVLTRGMFSEIKDVIFENYGTDVRMAFVLPKDVKEIQETYYGGMLEEIIVLSESKLEKIENNAFRSSLLQSVKCKEEALASLAILSQI